MPFKQVTPQQTVYSQKPSVACTGHLGFYNS